jgi:peptidoglycan/xylan/chitin deacetylase (PgdA/CDA1 family)
MNRRGSPIFLYHGVAGHGEDAIRDPLYALPLGSLRKHLSLLRARGCEAVTLGEFLSRGGACGNACVITIDDGLASAAARLFPEIARSGFRAVIFPVAGMVGRRGWVTWAELGEMLCAGFEVGSHGMTHANLAAAPPREAREELAGSKRLIEDRLGAPVRYFSLPGGYRGPSTGELAAEAGYEAICGSRFGYNRLPPDRFNLRRFCLRSADAAETVDRIMEGAFWPLASRYVRERGKGIGRSLLGGRIYAALRKRLVPAGAHTTLPRFPLE